MNKAFVREPDSDELFCPRCSALGEEVARDTLAAHLPEPVRRRLADSAAFCPTPTCDVAYFDVFEGVALAAELVRPVYPKDPQAPLCPCFGLTCDDVEQDLAEGKPTRIRGLAQQAKTPAAHCHTAAPTGRCCLPEVQRYYFRRQAARAEE